MLTTAILYSPVTDAYTLSTRSDRNLPGAIPRVAPRQKQRAAFPLWHNAPVPSFGALDARLLVVGLAPGLRGANRTGRPFTGDFAGDLLYRTLGHFGFAAGRYGLAPGDINSAVQTAIAARMPVSRSAAPFLSSGSSSASAASDSVVAGWLVATSGSAVSELGWPSGGESVVSVTASA